jgi:hypothetical protein
LGDEIMSDYKDRFLTANQETVELANKLSSCEDKCLRLWESLPSTDRMELIGQVISLYGEKRMTMCHISRELDLALSVVRRIVQDLRSTTKDRLEMFEDLQDIDEVKVKLQLFWSMVRPRRGKLKYSIF